VIPCAHLRVYQPLEAFPSHEQAHWERYIIEGVRARPGRPVYSERPTSGRLGVLTSAEGDHADVLLRDGRYFISPWRTRLRVLSSLVTLRKTSPLEMADFVVPEAEARSAARELASIRREHGDTVAFVQQSPWQVPIRWFLLFADEERTFTHLNDGGYRLTYETTLRQASDRTARALELLRGTQLESLADALDEVADWLDAFDEGSLLELDYGGLCDLLSWDELDDDHSARDLQDSLSALRSDRTSRSAELYRAVLGRWAEVRNHESLN
jgi:hypothetical protein